MFLLLNLRDFARSFLSIFSEILLERCTEGLYNLSITSLLSFPGDLGLLSSVCSFSYVIVILFKDALKLGCLFRDSFQGDMPILGEAALLENKPLLSIYKTSNSSLWITEF